MIQLKSITRINYLNSILIILSTFSSLFPSSVTNLLPKTYIEISAQYQINIIPIKYQDQAQLEILNLEH